MEWASGQRRWESKGVVMWKILRTSPSFCGNISVKSRFLQTLIILSEAQHVDIKRKLDKYVIVCLIVPPLPWANVIFH